MGGRKQKCMVVRKCFNLNQHHLKIITYQYNDQIVINEPHGNN